MANRYTFEAVKRTRCNIGSKHISLAQLPCSMVLLLMQPRGLLVECYSPVLLTFGR
jgi:hypothetical protein